MTAAGWFALACLVFAGLGWWWCFAFSAFFVIACAVADS